MISISLVRPGPLKSNMDKDYLPRRHGQKPVAYLHPRLKGTLGETLGVILYQEQVLKVAHDLAGMSYAEADGFRRAMTHDRSEEEMEKMRGAFISGAARNGVSRNIAEKVFEQLAAFAAYGFCKAHAAAYAEIAYQTLWLKCHYPAEFFAALLSNQPMGYYPPRVLVAEARRHGVKVLPLDVNSSCGNYTAEGEAMRIGLRQLKGMPKEALASILSERARDKFSSLRDFIVRTDVSQPIVENLVKVGAFDLLGCRDELLKQIAGLVSLRHKGGGASGSMFLDTEQKRPKGAAYDRRTKMLIEREPIRLTSIRGIMALPKLRI
jgi:error-prone DNA polymerase